MSGTYEYQADGSIGKSPALPAPLFIHVNGGQGSMPTSCLSELEEDSPVRQRRALAAIIALFSQLKNILLRTFLSVKVP